jgi:hypothetical protein
MNQELTVYQPQELSLRTIEELASFGKVMVESGMFPDVKSQAQAIVKILAGRELGLPALYSLQHVLVIKGKTCIDAGCMANLIAKSGRYSYRILLHTDMECEIAFFDGDRQMGPTSRFTIADAKAADLFGNAGDMWKKYPRNMLFARALSNGARWYLPHVIGGAYTPEEIGTIGRAEYRDYQEQPQEPAATATTGTATEVTPAATTVAPPAPKANGNGHGEAVNAPKPDWKKFWIAARGLGFERQDVYDLLGTTSMELWLNETLRPDAPKRTLAGALEELHEERERREAEQSALNAAGESERRAAEEAMAVAAGERMAAG